MKITEEMIEAARSAYAAGDLPNDVCSYEGMRDALEAALSLAESTPVPTEPCEWGMVPKILTPRIVQYLQTNTEMGAYVCENLLGAYGLMDEYHTALISACVKDASGLSSNPIDPDPNPKFFGQEWLDEEYRVDGAGTIWDRKTGENVSERLRRESKE